MRIWSLHPKYLDTKGLVELWRETLLAKHVLEGKTKGYKNHPQLNRFKIYSKPLEAINFYLNIVYKEAVERGYEFDVSKFKKVKPLKLIVTNGQMEYERNHLLAKLKTRNPVKYKAVKTVDSFEPHPLFTIVKGSVEDWEVISE
jgi:hypothetical protein